ncbi:MAG: TauD/TfdA family dioxygenase [Polyangia bacterium]
MKLVPLQPFGLRVECTSGTRLGELDVAQLVRWLDEHRVVQLRGIQREEAHALATACRRLGPLQPWSFGAVHELKQVERTDNYLYTEHAVPLHWDGAFADAVPHWLVFQCVRAPPDDAGGETVFVDTLRVLARADVAQRERWRRARVRYTTEKKAHYGGSFVSPVIAKHPTLGVDVIRYAEPVHDLNPVCVEPVDQTPDAAAALRAELSSALAAADATLSLSWQEGDFVIADNHALLHGRRAFAQGAPRHLQRVNVLDPDRRWRTMLRAAWRVRRPEFFRAELPILLVPALLCAPGIDALFGRALFEAAVLFFLLFNVGDMMNCWFDRDVDLHRKTHLAEAIAKMGRRAMLVQIAASALLAIGLGVHLALTLHRAWLAPSGILGALLGAGYTAPPLRLKSRGWLQLVAYLGLLFVGPMVMVSGVFLAVPSVAVIVVAVSFGLLQTGVLLVNTAEDLDEDEREHFRTIAVVLKALGTIRLARILEIVGGLGLLALFGGLLPMRWWPALAPLLAVTAWNQQWLQRLVGVMKPLDERERRAAIRAQGKHVPSRIEAGAWAALVAAAAVFIAGLK